MNSESDILKAPQLDKWELLLVRHCKKNKVGMRSFKRILGWRCAVRANYIDDYFVMESLLNIILKFGLMDFTPNSYYGNSILSFIQDLSPSKDGWFGKVDRWIKDKDKPKSPEEHFYGRIIQVLVSRLALTEVKKFNGSYTSPTWFKNKYGN